MCSSTSPKGLEDPIPHLRVVIDDDLFRRLPANLRFGALVSGHCLRYLSATADPDLAAAVAPPTGPETLLFRAGRDLFTQDELGVIYRAGRPFWSTPLLAYGTPRVQRSSLLSVGDEAALLFLNCAPDGWKLRIAVTAAVDRLYADPLVSKLRVPPAWLHAADALRQARAAAARSRVA